MSRRSLFLLFICLVLSTPVFSQSRNSEEKCEDGVEAHMRDKMSTGKTYIPYSFMDYEVFKPKEFTELEELIDLQETIPTLKHHYSRRKLDSLVQANENAIQAKKREIMDNKIHFSYSIIHTFVLKLSDDDIKVARYKFFLNHAFKVQDVNLIFSISCTTEQAKMYYYMQQGVPIYSNLSAYQDKSASQEIYGFFEKAMEENAYNENIFYSATAIIANIKKHGELDLDNYGEQQIEKWVEQSNIDGYKSKDYSYMLESKDAKGVINAYVMYHRYTYKEGEDKTLDTVAFVFDLNFVLTDIQRVENTREELFEKK